MADTLKYPFFYNSKNRDRVYDADSFEHWLKKFFTSGVFTGELQVLANGDMTVTLNTGYVNADGKVKFFTSEQIIRLEIAHATYDRIDSIVIERNDSERDITAKAVTGGYSSVPVPIAPVRENGVYQMVVAHISVVHGAVRITQADITDMRTDSELCGIVTGAVTQYDFSQFQAQFDGYFANYKVDVADEFTRFKEETERLEAAGWERFEKWFNEMKGQLSEDAAGHLEENKVNIVVSESDVPINSRKAKTFYFMVTDSIQTFGTAIKVSPNMGLLID